MAHARPESRGGSLHHLVQWQATVHRNGQDARQRRQGRALDQVRQHHALRSPRHQGAAMMDARTQPRTTVNDVTILSRADLSALMRFGDYVDAVADAFRLHAQGRAVLPPAMEIRADGGAFNVKGARLGDYVAVKTNSNFPENPKRGRPTIQGAILLFESGGALLALIDSIEITIKRTGAATAVAARYLARPDSAVATIVGCGAQGRVQLEALRHGLDIRRVFAVDHDPAAAGKFAAEIAAQGLEVQVPATLRAATLDSDVIVTCTTAHTPYLGVADVRPGTFIAAIGAD